VDPKERLVAVFMTQLYPGDFRSATLFRALTYQAIVR
jgi:hypothetical protein